MWIGSTMRHLDVYLCILRVPSDIPPSALVETSSHAGRVPEWSPMHLHDVSTTARLWNESDRRRFQELAAGNGDPSEARKEGWHRGKDQESRSDPQGTCSVVGVV